MEQFRAVAFCMLFSLAVASYVKEMQVLKPNVPYKRPGQLGGSFSYTNCNKTVAPVYVSALSISPDMVHLGGKITVSAEIMVTEDIGTGSSPTDEAVLEIKMKIGDKFKEMCELLGPKVCDQTGLCEKLHGLAAVCPKIITDQGSNCQCPFKKNTYSVKDITIPLPESPFEVDGSFDVTIHLIENGKELMCLDVKFCIEHC